jgi:tetratricopeptide (TPR) repeat protein
MKWINAYCLICTFLCATPSISQDFPGLRAMDAADSLFAAGEYFVASIEYERCYFLSDDPLLRTRANLAKAAALKQMGRFENARSDLQRSLPFAGTDSLRFLVLYELAFCSFMAGDHPGAASYIRQAGYFFPGRQSELRLLEALTMVQMERWTDLNEQLAKWLSEHLDGDQDALERAEGIVVEITGLTAAGALPRQRNPEKARLMSTFLPGLGHAYAGEAGKGLLNASSQLISLGLFGILAWNGFYVSSLTVGLSMFQSFYFGGIRQAGELAGATNWSAMASLKRQLSDRLIALELALGGSPVREPSWQ